MTVAPIQKGTVVRLSQRNANIVEKYYYNVHVLRPADSGSQMRQGRKQNTGAYASVTMFQISAHSALSSDPNPALAAAFANVAATTVILSEVVNSAILSMMNKLTE